MKVVFKNQTGSANSGSCIIKYRINFGAVYCDLLLKGTNGIILEYGFANQKF